MSSDRKKKLNPSSRYSRMEEPWLDDPGQGRSGSREGEPGNSGYGVRDSYSRQASYGRPDGYYDSYRPSSGMGDTKVFRNRNRSLQEDRYADAGYGGNERGYDGRNSRGYNGRNDRGYDGRNGRYDSGNDRGWDERTGSGYGGYSDGYSRDGFGADPDGYDSTAAGGYDVWDDPEYDDRYEETGGRRGRHAGDAGRKRPGSGADGDPEAVFNGGREPERRGARRKERRDARYEPDDGPMVRGAYGDTAGTGRRGFVIKLILLLLATAALAGVWRVSRMERTRLTDILVNEGASARDGYQDFVIYGVDSREGSLTKEAHSDTIILCSLNRKTKEVRMVSVYRDTYLDNTNGEYRKATECYYFGGPERSVNMLNKNLDLSLQDYVTVDFNAVVKAVDLIGGVDVDVTEEELPWINGYQTENAQVTGAQITPVTSAGYQTLNGIQALAYCRIRYTAGSDYKRTERQRAVLTQIFEKAKHQGAVKMAQMVDTMLPYIATSFSNTELLNLASGISDYALGESAGFPFELQAANISAGDCVIPATLARNVTQLHTFLYGEAGYDPSAAVQQISAEISAATGIY